jgi:hypothetical protein
MSLIPFLIQSPPKEGGLLSSSALQKSDRLVNTNYFNSQIEWFLFWFL